MGVRIYAYAMDMIFKSLYTKLLFSFMGILIVTLILILGLFFSTAGKTFRDRIDEQSFGKLKIFQNIIEDQITDLPDVPISDNLKVKEILCSFSELFNLKIWITSPDGAMVFKTFPEPEPEHQTIETKKRKIVVREGIKLYHVSRRHFSYYSQIPLHTRADIHTLHIYLPPGIDSRPEAIFFIGILIIGTVISVLVFPLTRIITRRIKQLNQSALEFAEGRLDKRISIKGRDEIAELGNSFNFMADKLEKMILDKKKLTANLSHELRSPLARIRVANELIQDKAVLYEDTNINRYSAHIEHEIQILDTLIEKILTLSKLDLQEAALSIEPLNIGLMIDDLEKKYLPSMEQKKINLVKDVDPSLILNLDKSCISSIFLNLMDNAVKYTHENGIIRILSRKPKDDILCFSITNTFRPLTTAELENIFEPFFRIEPGQNPGTGLGLAIVKRLVSRCQSNIEVKNSKDGLCFEILFQGK